MERARAKCPFCDWVLNFVGQDQGNRITGKDGILECQVDQFTMLGICIHGVVKSGYVLKRSDKVYLLKSARSENLSVHLTG